MKLKIRVTTDRSNSEGNCLYKNKIEGKNYKELAIILNDLKNIGLPLDKAIKEYKLTKSDWEVALGF